MANHLREMADQKATQKGNDEKQNTGHQKKAHVEKDENDNNEERRDRNHVGLSCAPRHPLRLQKKDTTSKTRTTD